MVGAIRERALPMLLLASSLVAGRDAVAAPAVPDWMRSAIPAALPSYPADTKAVVLLDDTRVTVSPNDVTTRRRQVMKILTNAGRDYAWTAAHFDNDTKLLALRGWSIDAQGKAWEVRERDAVETSTDDVELYSDARAKVLRIPSSDPGAVIAWEVETRERPHLMQDVWHFQQAVPVLHARYELALPAGWLHEARWSRHDPVEPVAANGALTWSLRDLPAIAEEPGMPGAAELEGRMGIRYRAAGARDAWTWGEIAGWFGGLARDRSAVTPEIAAKVRELTQGRTPEESVRALARFARGDIRYVAVAIGIGGYQPHAAAEVFRNRYGDCKDKATLFRTMLKQIGVESYYVLVNTSRGFVDREIPVMGAFNHVILAIPTKEKLPAAIAHAKLGGLLMFDPTSTTTGFGDLPPWLQDSRGLLVAGDRGELIDLPAHVPAASQLRRSAKLRLDPTGTLSGDVEEVRLGAMAAGVRGALQALTAAERTRWVESAASSHLAQHTIAGIAIENLDDPDRDLVIRYTVTAKNYARRAADLVLVRPRVVGQKAETVLDLSKRQYGYVTAGPSLQTDEVEIAIPAALELDELPAAVNIATDAVSYASGSEIKGEVLRYRRRYELRSFLVPREGLPELNRAFTAILADERASAVFVVH